MLRTGVALKRLTFLSDVNCKMTLLNQMLFILMAGCVGGTAGQCINDIDIPPTDKTLLSAMEEFFRGSTHFSLNLLRALNHSTDIFFSPFSVWSTLVLVYLGSRSNTEKELQGVLGLREMDKVLVAHSYRALQHWFTSRTVSSSSSSFSMVNKLFLQKDVGLRKCLLEYISDDLAYIDFYKNPELARIAINMWVRSKTKDRIKEILPPQSVQKYTEFVATSTMYFKAAWLAPFHLHVTSSRPFYQTAREFIMVDMMVTRDTFLYTTSEELQCSAIELPYLGRSTTMVIMLPNNKAHGVRILANSLSPSRLYNMTEDMFPREVVVHLPKFQMDVPLQLSSTLSKMGLRELFNSNSVDLSGFTKEKHLEVQGVYHKAFVSVNEHGTEASAATSLAISRSSRPTRVLNFVVDRPFIFYIREDYSGSILFMGAVYNPKYPAPRV